LFFSNQSYILGELLQKQAAEAKRKGLEACAQCSEFPCSKFKSGLETGGEYDSFLTHKKAKLNLDFIRTYGLEEFAKQQRKRIKLLEKMIRNFDDGRSKSFYCVAATLLPGTALEATIGIVNSNDRDSNTISDAEMQNLWFILFAK
jgi:hypothetical protein